MSIADPAPELDGDLRGFELPTGIDVVQAPAFDDMQEVLAGVGAEGGRRSLRLGGADPQLPFVLAQPVAEDPLDAVAEVLAGVDDVPVVGQRGIEVAGPVRPVFLPENDPSLAAHGRHTTDGLMRHILYNDAMRRTTIMADEDTLERLRGLALDRGVSFAEIAREALVAKATEYRPKPTIIGMFAGGGDAAEYASEPAPPVS